MPITINNTHDPKRRSWVDSANAADTDFPIQNLPFGVFSTADGPDPRIGVAIGDQILDLRAAVEAGLLDTGIPKEVFRSATLDALLGCGVDAMSDLRARLSALLDAQVDVAQRRELEHLLASQSVCRMHRPTFVRSYTDFYAGIYHALTAGAMMAPDRPLPPNYKWVPIGYNGRASSVQVSGAPVRRPRGQRPPEAQGAPPSFGPSLRLDIELEMGIFVGADNILGEPVTISRAADHIAGFCLLNDWSARDIQVWEMVPLGPFLSKSFATSISPWVLTAEAMAPFRTSAMVRPAGDPAPLPYLLDESDQHIGGLDVGLEVQLRTRSMRDAGQPAVTIITSNARHLYWTPAQMLAHHTVNGCNLQVGDLFGTGTISGPTDAELSSMLELTFAGTRPVKLPNGEYRGFLEDGDEITLRGHCAKEGFVSIGFGTCTGEILPALEDRAR
jgi:fumarylacetoacetase